MRSLKTLRVSLCLAIFLVISAISRPGLAQDIQWPSNTINLSQLESIFSQYPGINQFNIQFPNQTNWGITPGSVQTLVNNFQQEAQSLGVKGALPDLSFSSLAGGGLKGGLAQLAINNSGDLKGQMDDVLRQLRYQTLDLSDALPDWLKQFLLAIYDAVYSGFEFLGQKLASLFR